MLPQGSVQVSIREGEPLEWDKLLRFIGAGRSKYVLVSGLPKGLSKMQLVSLFAEYDLQKNGIVPHDQVRAHTDIGGYCG